MSNPKHILFQFAVIFATLAYASAGLIEANHHGLAYAAAPVAHYAAAPATSYSSFTKTHSPAISYGAAPVAYGYGHHAAAPVLAAPALSYAAPIAKASLAYGHSYAPAVAAPLSYGHAYGGYSGYARAAPLATYGHHAASPILAARSYGYAPAAVAPLSYSNYGHYAY